VDLIGSSPIVTHLTKHGVGRKATSLSLVAADKIIDPSQSVGGTNVRSNWNSYHEVDRTYKVRETRYR